MANVRKTVVFDIQGNSSSYEAAAEKAAKASKKAETAADKANEVFGKLGQSSGKAAGALELFGPTASDAARGLADLADVGEVGAVALSAMGPAVLALGVALGGLAIAALDYVKEGEKLEAHLEAVKKDAEDAAPAIAALADEQLVLAVASKQLTQEQADAIRGATSAQRDYVGSVEDNIEANKALYDEQSRLTTQIAALEKKQEDGFDADSKRAGARAAEAAQLANLKARLGEVTAEIDRNNSEVGKAAGVYVQRVTVGEQVAAVLTKQRKAEEDLRAAEELAKQEALERKAAAESFLQAVRDIIDAENAEFKLAKERAKVAEANAKIIADAEEATAERRAEAEYTAWARTQEMEAERTALYEKGAQDRIDIANDEAAAILDAAADVVEALGAIADAQLEARESALADVQAQVEELDELIADLGDSTVSAAELSGQALVDAYKAGEVAAADLSDSQKALIEAKLEAERAAAKEQEAIEREAALEAFNIQKGTAIAGTIVAGLQGAVAAFQLGPIAGAIAAAAIGVLTATNVALIAAEKPSFHAGGVRGGTYPDEVNSVTLPGEGWANRQAMNDPANRAALDAMNAGHSVGGGTTVLRIGRKESREVARTDIRSNGIIPQTIRSIARRSGNGAGLSGRGVLA